MNADTPSGTTMAFIVNIMLSLRNAEKGTTVDGVPTTPHLDPGIWEQIDLALAMGDGGTYLTKIGQRVLDSGFPFAADVPPGTRSRLLVHLASH